MSRGNLANVHKAHAAPRCTAKSKRTGEPCKGPAVKGWNVCRMHGAKGGAPSGPANGQWRHGNRTRASDALRSTVAELVGQARHTAKELDGD
jgi:hypothetical protein